MCMLVSVINNVIIKFFIHIHVVNHQGQSLLCLYILFCRAIKIDLISIVTCYCPKDQKGPNVAHLCPSWVVSCMAKTC